MKKQIIRMALSLCGAIGLLVSCGQDEPVKPKDETQNKLHEMPFSASYFLTEAELSSPEVFDANPELHHAKPTGNVQTIKYKLEEGKGWHIPEDSPDKAFKVKTMKESPSTVYILTIEYRNAKGELMNSQFIDNGQDKIHQHFFTYYKGGLRVKDKAKLPYDYRYADTTPWDSAMGAYTADKNPIGFKGLIRFTGEKSFSLNADLVHAFETKYEPDGSTNPFYLVSDRLKASSDQDVSVKLPIKIGEENSNNNHAGEENNNENNTTTPSAGDAPQGAFGKLNTTKVAKMVLKIYEGHLHKPDSYHYVAGPVVPTPSLRMEQEMTFVYEGGVWRNTPKTTYNTIMAKDEEGEDILKYGEKTLHLDSFFFLGSTSYDGLPTPVYGCWIEYYDADGNKINGDFVAPGEYQHFFTLTDVQPIGGKPVDGNRQTPELMQYKYKDTTPWDKSAHSDGAPYTDPIGMKGYFNFIKAGYKATLNVELRKGGVNKDSFYTSNGGEAVLRVSIPIYVPYLKADIEGFAVLDSGDTWDKLSPEMQKVADELIQWLKIAGGRDGIIQDLIYLFNGDRGNEQTSGVWF